LRLSGRDQHANIRSCKSTATGSANTTPSGGGSSSSNVTKRSSLITTWSSSRGRRRAPTRALAAQLDTEGQIARRCGVTGQQSLRPKSSEQASTYRHPSRRSLVRVQCRRSHNKGQRSRIFEEPARNQRLGCSRGARRPVARLEREAVSAAHLQERIRPGIRALQGSRRRDRDAPDEGRAGVGRWDARRRVTPQADTAKSCALSHQEGPCGPCSTRVGVMRPDAEGRSARQIRRVVVLHGNGELCVALGS